MEKVILLDAGHGGIIDGKYVTPGKRSPEWKVDEVVLCDKGWPHGPVYYEGVGNRMIREELAKLLLNAGIPFHFVTTGNADVPLHERSNIINNYARIYGAENCLGISIHSDGFTDPAAQGCSVFTSEGETLSDKVSPFYKGHMAQLFPWMRFRGDKDKNYWILAKTHCPMILTENGFHTNPKECQEVLMTEVGRYSIALAHFRMIQDFLNL